MDLIGTKLTKLYVHDFFFSLTFVMYFTTCIISFVLLLFPEAEFPNILFVEVSDHNLEVSVYNVYITNQFKTTFAPGVGGVEVTVNSKKTRLLSQFRPRILGLCIVNSISFVLLFTSF